MLNVKSPFRETKTKTSILLHFTFFEMIQLQVLQALDVALES